MADDSDGSAHVFVTRSEPDGVRLIRRHVRAACAALGREDASDPAALLVSEVATNAMLHAYGPEIRVRVLRRGPRLRVEVADGSPVLPLPRRATRGAENGRGMAIVDALAADWGSVAAADGKTVWFELGP